MIKRYTMTYSGLEESATGAWVRHDEHVAMLSSQGFEEWWQDHGQFCRGGGGEYEKTFAYRAWESAAPTAPSAWIDVDAEVPADGQEVIILYWPYGNRENRQSAMGCIYDARNDEFLTDNDGDTAHRPSHWIARPALPANPTPLPGTS